MRTLSIREAYSFSSVFPSKCSLQICSNQPESRNVNFPASGISLKNRYKNGYLSSSSVGSDIVTTLKKRGSIFRITLPIVLPFPDVPQPSKSTITGILCSLIFICKSYNCFLAVDKRSFISSFSGIRAGFQFINISESSLFLSLSLSVSSDTAKFHPLLRH